MTRTKDKLLRVATQLFSERGFNGVTIREISHISDVSISMISYYFGGKEALYAHILQEQFSCYDYVEELKTMETSPLARMRNYIKWSLLKHRDNIYFSKLYISELVNPTRFHETIVKPLLAKSYKALLDIIDEGKSLNIINETIDSNAIATMIVTTANYITFYNGIDSSIDNYTAIDIDSITDNYMSIIMDGIYARPAKAGTLTKI